MRQVFILCMCVLYSLCITAQNEYDPKPLFQLPPSPDAAALGRYGQYPVSLYNGLVQIDIPIHTIDLPMLKLPISLSYHASGIRVNDISSVVGLGWALNAGGVITRSVRGLPDSNFGFNSILPDEQMINNIINEEDKANKLATLFRLEQWETSDTESDVYYYNVGSFSGSFRFDIKGNLIQIPLSDHKIEYIGGYFQLTTSDGTVYIFRDTETTRYLSMISGQKDHISSWYISSITTPDQKSVHFNYMTDNTNYNEHYLSNTITVDHVVSGYKGIEYHRPRVESNNTIILTSIEYPEGKINFNYSDDRADRRKYRLSSISVRNHSTGIKSFTLKHSYFTPIGVASKPEPEKNYSDRYSYRLKLDKVSLSEMGMPIGAYNFDYNTTHLLPPYYKAPTPDKRYYSQDYWGYYNGAENINLITYNNPANHYVPYTPANREVNTACAQACILKKITYPTGGFTLFEYESNKSSVGTVGGLRIKNILSYHDQNDEPIVRSYQYAGASDNNAGETHYKGTIYTQGKTVTSAQGPEMRMYNYYLSEANTPLSFTDGATVFYKKVTEFEGYPDNSNGKTEYSFLYLYNDTRYNPLQHCEIPTPQSGRFYTRLSYLYEDRSWTRGYTNQIDIYKKEGSTFSLIKSTQNSYRILDEKDVIVGFRCFPNYDTTDRFLPPPYNIYVKRASELYQYTNILAKTGIVKLMEVKEITYTETESITETTSYSYDWIAHQYEPTTIKRILSDGSVLKSTFQYPKDLQYSKTFCKAMVNDNMVSQVIRQTDSLDNKQLRIIENNYGTFSGKILPASITMQQGVSKTTEVAYTNYDDKGNITGIRRNDATNEAIIWGYNKTLPVAKLENISYSSISSTLINYINQLETISSVTLQTQREKLRTINQNIRNNLPHGVTIVTYTHQPMAGPTSYTDEQGLTTYYGYDGLGRIKEVFILEGDTKKSIRTHTYNYYNN